MRLTHPGKVLFPDAGLTKADLADYYEKAAPFIAPHLKGRIVSLVRCPDGVADDCFFQRHPMDGQPDCIGTVTVRGRDALQTYLRVEDDDALAGLAQLAAIEIHDWGAPAADPDAPDRLVLDLDPDAGLPFATAKKAARRARALFASLGLASYAKLTGGKGIHVVVPLAGGHGWEEVKGFARAAARSLAEDAPDALTVHPSKSRRTGKVFIDYLRNDHSQTAIMPFSPRARPGAPVACPVGWDELGRMDTAAAYSMKTLLRRLSRLKADPWADYASSRQRLSQAMRREVSAG